MDREFDWYDPECIYLTAGAASGGTGLNAFDNALRDAGITDFNLIRITSVAPAGTPVEHLDVNKVIPANGLLGPTIYEDIRSGDSGTQVASAVGIGIPDEYVEPGMIFSYSCKGTDNDAKNILKQMIDEGMRERGCNDFSKKMVSESMEVGSPYSAVVAAALFCNEEINDIIKSMKKDD